MTIKSSQELSDMFNDLAKCFIKNDLQTALKRSRYESSYLSIKDLSVILIKELGHDEVIELMKCFGEIIN
jgi:hypothetical protein